MRFLIGAAVFLAVPLAAAEAACDTEQGQEMARIHYSQAMAAWQQADPLAFDAAQEQLRADAAAARRGGAVKQCQFLEKAIKQAHSKAEQPVAPAADE
jgi:hypothetical protein